MPLYTEPDEPEFVRLETQHRWFYGVLLADYGEIDGAPTPLPEPPAALNWLAHVPPARRLDFEDVECNLAFVDDGATGYECTVWDATGENDDPWAVFVADDRGPRLLPEYSVFDEEASEAEREDALARAASELPERLLQGEFTRALSPLPEVPDWLQAAREREVG